MRLVFAVILAVSGATAQVQSSDALKLRSVVEVQFSPDGSRLAYTVENNDAPGRPWRQIWIMNLADGKSVRMGGEKDKSSGPEWSPQGDSIAYRGPQGLAIARADGSGVRAIHPMEGTNGPVPETGKDIAWSPDGKRIAFIHSLPGPEEPLTGDPIVITRYLYKPDFAEGISHFNDNRRLHIFLADAATGQVTQLTSGDHYEHSLDWSPNGEEILFLSNREPNEDQFFNYDVFALKVSDRSLRRITATESAEYMARWSPDGKRLALLATKRGLTDLETTMEDTHVWVMNADGSGRREIAAIDNRQGPPRWSADGRWVYFTVQERGSVKLVRVSSDGGMRETVVHERGAVRAWSVSRDGRIAYCFHSPRDVAQLYMKEGAAPARKLTDLNAAVLGGKQLGEVESFTFVSNDNKFEIEAFLTKPLGMTATSRHPLIVLIHGGPHGQQGPTFTLRSQVYASRGWATLMVNYRGSTGYGQAFADAVFADQNGNEGQDVLYGLSAALRRYLWIDRDRLGVEGVSYGGQLSAWLVTQTSTFKAAIPIAPIINIISYNYMTYYNQYEQMAWGIFPHQGNMMDVLWERSALKHVAKVKTPVMLQHGENDADVPIAESEQYYIALRDVGVDAVMIRYPREGHGLREPKHQVDSVDRSIAWYLKYFPK